MRKKVICLFICAFLAVCGAQTQEAQSSGALKDAFAHKNTDEILAVLTASASDEEKASVEALVLAEAKALAFSGDLDTASKYSETVVMFDFSNAEAQDLYLSIENEKTAKANLLAKQKADADAKAKAEEQRKAEEAERDRVLAARQELERKAAEDQKAKDDYIASVRIIGRKNFTGSVFASPLASALLSRSDFAKVYSGSSATNVSLFLPVGAEIAFDHPYVHAALNGRAGFSAVPLGDAERQADFSVLATVGSPSIRIPVCLAAGVMKFWIMESNAESMLVTDILSPTIGLAVDHLAVGKIMDLSASVVWLPASRGLLVVENAFAGELAVRVKLFGNEKYRFFVSPAVSGTLVTGSSKAEWTCKPAVYAGVTIK